MKRNNKINLLYKQKIAQKDDMDDYKKCSLYPNEGLRVSYVFLRADSFCYCASPPA